MVEQLCWALPKGAPSLNNRKAKTGSSRSALWRGGSGRYEGRERGPECREHGHPGEIASSDNNEIMLASMGCSLAVVRCAQVALPWPWGHLTVHSAGGNEAWGRKPQP